MKCFNCKKNIDHDHHLTIIHVGDGDHVCSEKCHIEFLKKRNEFFDNIQDDDYYETWLNENENLCV